MVTAACYKQLHHFVGTDDEVGIDGYQPADQADGMSSHGNPGRHDVSHGIRCYLPIFL
jgi:hypothetical protein